MPRGWSGDSVAGWILVALLLLLLALFTLGAVALLMSVVAATAPPS